MRCIACNEMLTDDEATARYIEDNKHINLCSYCRAMNKDTVLEYEDDEFNSDNNFGFDIDMTDEGW